MPNGGNESLSELRSRVETLTRSLAAVNQRVASLDPTNGDVGGMRRKIFDLEQRLSAIERGEGLAVVLASRPYSD